MPATASRKARASRAASATGDRWLHPKQPLRGRGACSRMGTQCGQDGRHGVATPAHMWVCVTRHALQLRRRLADRSRCRRARLKCFTAIFLISMPFLFVVHCLIQAAYSRFQMQACCYGKNIRSFARFGHLRAVAKFFRLPLGQSNSRQRRYPHQRQCGLGYADPRSACAERNTRTR